MFTTSPHLTARRPGGPSPTSVQYTVSNAPRRRTAAARALLGVALLVRGVAVVLVLLFLGVKAACGPLGAGLDRGMDRDLGMDRAGSGLESAGGSGMGIAGYGGSGMGIAGYGGSGRASAGASVAGRLGARCQGGALALAAVLFDGTALAQPWELAVPLCLGALYLCLRRWHTEESLLVLRTLGLQTATTSGSYLSGATMRFIPTSQIQDIFIHEAFIGFEVRYYLAIVVQGESEVTVVFPNLLPKLAIVEEVWRGARACLFEVPSKAAREGER